MKISIEYLGVLGADRRQHKDKLALVLH